MSNYVQSTNFATKDALSLGDPLKIVKGTEINAEFNNIATAVGTKADIVSPTFTGTPAAPTAIAGTSTAQLATTAFATAVISPFTGSMLMWPTATPPSGFLLCSGAAVSRTTYAALFAIVGVIFGSGDGSTTFNLPDYRDRSPVGAGTTYAAAATGGSKDAVVVSHNHTATSIVTDPGHIHQSRGAVGGSSIGIGGTDSDNANNLDTSSAATGVTVATTNTAVGVSGTNANLPPYIGIFFIIKT